MARTELLGMTQNLSQIQHLSPFSLYDNILCQDLQLRRIPEPLLSTANPLRVPERITRCGL